MKNLIIITSLYLITACDTKRNVDPTNSEPSSNVQAPISQKSALGTPVSDTISSLSEKVLDYINKNNKTSEAELLRLSAELFDLDAEKALFLINNLPAGGKRTAILDRLAMKCPDAQIGKFISFILANNIEDDSSSLRIVLEKAGITFEELFVFYRQSANNQFSDVLAYSISKKILDDGKVKNPRKILEAYAPLEAEKILPIFYKAQSRINTPDFITEVNAMPSEMIKIVEEVLPSLGMEQADSVAPWLLNYASKVNRPDLLQKFVAGWLHEDSISASKWVADLPKGYARSYGATAVHNYLKNQGAEKEASSWSEEIVKNPPESPLSN
jgi:hypothetical protein